MPQILTACAIFIFTSLYVLLLQNLADSSRVILKVIIVPIGIFLVFLYFLTNSSRKDFLLKRSKWFFLLFSTIILQLLILSTGGLNSPFLILIHFSMVGFSFLFNFTISLLFLIFSFSLFLSDMYFNHNLLGTIAENPRPLVLQIASLIPIIPTAYIISQHYHAQNMLSKTLKKKVLADEVVLSNLDEMIIITDLDFNILSVNDAVLRTTHKSHTELLDTSIFTSLLLKDNSGKLLTKEKFLSENAIKKTYSKITLKLTLMRADIPQQHVTLRMQPVHDPQGKITQLSFIIDQNTAPATPATNILLDRAKARYEAIASDMKKELVEHNMPELSLQLIFLHEIANDINTVQSLQSENIDTNTMHIDLAQLAKHIVLEKQDIAAAHGVALSFEILHFGEKEIRPLVTDNFSINPDKFTGPFFTITCDVKKLELLVRKMIDLALLLASSENKPQVTFTLERAEEGALLITITGTNPHLPSESIASLFIPYYEEVSVTTNLQNGSGFEGYMVKKLSELMDYPLTVTLQDKPTPNIKMTLLVTK